MIMVTTVPAAERDADDAITLCSAAEANRRVATPWGFISLPPPSGGRVLVLVAARVHDSVLVEIRPSAGSIVAARRHSMPVASVFVDDPKDVAPPL